MGGSRSVAAQSTPLMVPFSVPKGNGEEGSRGGDRTAVFHSSGGRAGGRSTARGGGGVTKTDSDAVVGGGGQGACGLVLGRIGLRDGPTLVEMKESGLHKELDQSQEWAAE
jgi:hypothetical protein